MTTSNPIDRLVVKIPTGVEPIDRILGGLERDRCHYLFGNLTAARSTAAVHFLIRGLQNKERVVFITRSAGPEVVERMSQMGYDYSTDVRTEQFIILEYTDDIVEQIQNLADFDAVIRELEALLAPRKPARLVFDPIGYLFVSRAGDDPVARIRKFVSWLTSFGTTTLIVGGNEDSDAIVGALHDCCETALRVNRKTFGAQEANVLSFVKTSAAIQLAEEAFMVDSEKGIVPVVIRPPSPPPPAELEPVPPPPLPRFEPALPASAQAAPPLSRKHPYPWEMPAQAPPVPHSEPPASAYEETTRIAQPPAEEQYKILVIDDDPATCNLVSMALREDCSVTAVHDGASGLNAIKNESYDLVILDVNLPIVDGFHVCQHIRKTHWQVPIIIITGTHLRAEDRLQSASVGGDLYLTKPFSVQELRLRVRQLIGRYRDVPEWVGAGASVGLESQVPPPIEQPPDQVASFEDFVRRIEHERRVSRAAGMPFSIVSCRLQGNGSSASEDKLLEMIRAQMRENDLMTIDRDQRSLILLPEASAEGAQIFIQRVRQMSITEMGIDPVFQWRTYPTDGENIEQLLMRPSHVETPAVTIPSPPTVSALPPVETSLPAQAEPYLLAEETTRIQQPQAEPPLPPPSVPLLEEVTLDQGLAPESSLPPVAHAEPAEAGLDLKSLVKEIFREELREFVRDAVRESMRVGTQQRITPSDIRNLLSEPAPQPQREAIPATKRPLPQPELTASAPSTRDTVQKTQAALPHLHVEPSARQALISPPPPSLPQIAPLPTAVSPPTQEPAATATPKPAEQQKADLRWSFIDFMQRR